MEKKLVNTYAFLLREHGSRINIRIDTSREDRVVIELSRQPGNSVIPFLTKSIPDFHKWYDSNVEPLFPSMPPSEWASPTNISQFLSLHRVSKVTDGLRLGQRFVIRYFKDPKAIPGLFNEPEHSKALTLILKWLEDNQYGDSSLPPEVVR